MTLFGPDVSSHQDDVNWSQVAAESFDFAFIKATQGNWYTNPYFAKQLAGARAAGLIAIPYHYIEAASSADSQADHFASVVRSLARGIAIDHEEGSGDEAQNYAVANAMRARNYQVVLNYLPEWYWTDIGKPTIRTGPLWKSWYPDTNQDYASNIYARCPASAWDGYGGQPVALRQFANSALIADKVMDCSAFEGTLEEFRALAEPHTDPSLPEDDMGLLTTWRVDAENGRAYVSFECGIGGNGNSGVVNKVWVSAKALWGDIPATRWVIVDDAGQAMAAVAGSDVDWSAVDMQGNRRLWMQLPPGASDVTVDWDPAAATGVFSPYVVSN